MNQPKPLTESLRESIEERKQLELAANDHPAIRKGLAAQFKLDALAKELPEMKLVLNETNFQNKFFMATCREVSAENKTLKSNVDFLKREADDMKAAIGEQQIQIDELRTLVQPLLDRFAEWARSKGKTS